MTHRAIAGLCLSLIAVGGSVRLPAQGLSVDVSAGRLVYDPLSTDLGTNNLMGTIRYDTVRQAWVYGTAAPPLGDGATFWGGAGTGGRFAARSSSRVVVGADLAAHGYTFRDAVVDQVGTGAIADAMPFVRMSAGLGFVEGRGGWRGHTLSLAEVRERRDVFETGARGGYGARLRIEGDARWVHATEGTFPSVGVSLAYVGGPVQMWGHTGKWLHADLDEATWGGGIAVSVSARSTVWANVRQQAPDPLYWNTTQRTWSVGMTQRLGRVVPPLRIVSPTQTGSVVITLHASDAPSGEVSIAGDFNNWQPTPMHRDGDRWTIRLPLLPGVYHYAFRSATGTWFVPSSTLGRREDGMGGHVAVLLVT
jgi:hypothetical protein